MACTTRNDANVQVPGSGLQSMFCRSVYRSLNPLPAGAWQVYKKTNGSVGFNRELKVHIENMRREKIMSEGILISLQRELERVKVDMTELITVANQTFKAKEKILNEIGNVNRQFEKEQMNYEEEWKYLTRVIEQDKKASDDRRAAGGAGLGWAGLGETWPPTWSVATPILASKLQYALYVAQIHRRWSPCCQHRKRPSQKPLYMLHSLWPRHRDV